MTHAYSLTGAHSLELSFIHLSCAFRLISVFSLVLCAKTGEHVAFNPAPRRNPPPLLFDTLSTPELEHANPARPAMDPLFSRDLDFRRASAVAAAIDRASSRDDDDDDEEPFITRSMSGGEVSPGSDTAESAGDTEDDDVLQAPGIAAAGSDVAVATLRAQRDEARAAAERCTQRVANAEALAARLALERDAALSRVAVLEPAVDSLHQQLLADQCRSAGEIAHYISIAADLRERLTRAPGYPKEELRRIDQLVKEVAAGRAEVALRDAEIARLEAIVTRIAAAPALGTSAGDTLGVLLETVRAGLDQRISTMSYFSADRALMNPCLRSGAAMAKFQQGLARASGEGLAACVAGGNFVVAFHGTPCVEDILCRGFDTKLRNRNGQVHGAGEYFARDSGTAEIYAEPSSIVRGTPGVVVTLIIKSKARRVNDGMWFVVDNPADDATSSYCLPLMAVPVQGVSDLQPCRRCAPQPFPAAAFAGADEESRTVEFEDDSGAWTAMAADVATIVLAAFDRQQTVGVVTVRGNVYDFDWQRMEQINTMTRTRRRIRIADP